MFENYFSSIKEMQAQLFHVLAIAASVANMFGVALNAFLHGNALPTQVCVLCGIVILLFGLWGVYTRHKGAAAVGILITVVWIEFPFLYSVYGTVILVYFVLSVLGITIFFPQKFSLPFCSMTIIWDIVVIIIIHFGGTNNVSIDGKYKLLFTICSYLIVAVACFVLLNLLILRYEHQKEELCAKNEQLDYVATHDPLTNLYNRGYLISEIDKRIQKNHAGFISVIMDIDDFKKINDTYGHIFGDSVLVTFAKLMEQEIEGQGFAARFGGEEFMMIFDHDNQTAAMESLHNLATKLESFYKREKQITVTFSGGLELYSSNKKIDEIIINADRKLYQAKKNGKKQVVC